VAATLTTRLARDKAELSTTCAHRNHQVAFWIDCITTNAKFEPFAHLVCGGLSVTLTNARTA
jgi:hypothetical protein